MDYSTIQEDNSTDSSPWASSPQQHPRANLNTPINDEASLTPQVQPQPQSQTNYPYRNGAQDPESNQRGEGYNPASTGIENGHYDQTRQSERAPADGLRQQPQAQQQQQSQTPQQQKQQSQTTPQRPQVHYKLQAKVNGLERSGRKDPILRFDVHVGRRNVRCCR